MGHDSFGGVRVSCKIGSQRTIATIRSSSAMRFADSDCERMKFVEELRLIRWGILTERDARELHERLVSLAAPFGSRVDELMPDHDAAEVFICNRDGMPEGVK